MKQDRESRETQHVAGESDGVSVVASSSNRRRTWETDERLASDGIGAEIAIAFTIDCTTSVRQMIPDNAESPRDNRAIDRAHAKSPICDSVAVDSPLII